MNGKTNIKDLKAAAAMFGSIVPFGAKWKGDCKPDMKWLAKPFEWEDSFVKVFCEGCGVHTEDVEEIMAERFEQLGKKGEHKLIDWHENYLHMNTCEFCIKNAPVQTIEFTVRKIEREKKKAA